MLNRKHTKLNAKQKSPHLKGPILVFSSIAEEGFEPPIFGI